MDLIGDIALIGLFILIGGTFAAAEMALVTLRDSQLAKVSARGKRGRAVARLSANPNLFLSSVQIGVTLSGFLSAAFGGATLASRFAPALETIGVPRVASQTLALVLVTAVISFFSIVVGELTAKRLAMQRPESTALSLAPLVSGIATIARPLIWLLDVSTNLLVRLLGGDPSQRRDAITDEEIRQMVGSSDTLGHFERRILDEVFDAGGHNLREVMVPRTEVSFLDADLPLQLAYREVRGGAHSRYPVMDGSVDRILGFLHVRDLMALEGEAWSGEVRDVVREALNLPETVPVLRALSVMQADNAHMAIVRDEYGGTSGIVTMEDLVEELVGEITDEYDVVEKGETAVNQVDGLTTLEEFEDLTGLVLPEGPYDTVAGHFMAELGRVPEVGDSVTVRLHTSGADQDSDGEVLVMTVTDMDSRRASGFSLRREQRVGEQAQEKIHG